MIPFPGTATEVVEPLNRDDAERLDKRMRLLVGTITDNMAKLYELVERAKRGNVHATLGFPSWTAYIADVFTVQVRLEPGQRRELVGYLSGEGMSDRVIADVIGVSDTTVLRDRHASHEAPDEPITSRNGKTCKRKPRPADPKQEPLTREEAEELTGRIRGWVNAQPNRDEAVRQVREAKGVADAIFRIPDNIDDAIVELDTIGKAIDEHLIGVTRVLLDTVAGSFGAMTPDGKREVLRRTEEFLDFINDHMSEDRPEDG